MFTCSNELAKIRRQLVERTRQPEPGTLIYAVNKTPMRVRYQVRERVGKPGKEVFAYATIVAADGRFDVNPNARFTARDFASMDYRGTKAILLTNARNRLVAKYVNEPVLSTCECLPVRAIRVVANSQSGMSVTCEVAEYCSEPEAELCAALVAAMDAGVVEQEAIAAFYHEFQLLKTMKKEPRLNEA